MYKQFIVLVAIIAVAWAAGLSEQQKELLRNHHAECLTESGVAEDLVTKARQGEFTDDPKLKEHLFCVSKKIGLQNAAGDIQEDVLRTKVNSVVHDNAKTEELIKNCLVKKDTPQDTAYETVKCYHHATHVV